MNLSKIHHIAIIVSDYEAAKDFYVNKLGFSVIRENYRPERKDLFFASTNYLKMQRHFPKVAAGNSSKLHKLLGAC